MDLTLIMNDTNFVAIRKRSALFNHTSDRLCIKEEKEEDDELKNLNGILTYNRANKKKIILETGHKNKGKYEIRYIRCKFVVMKVFNYHHTYIQIVIETRRKFNRNITRIPFVHSINHILSKVHRKQKYD